MLRGVGVRAGRRGPPLFGAGAFPPPDACPTQTLGTVPRERCHSQEFPTAAGPGGAFSRDRGPQHPILRWRPTTASEPPTCEPVSLLGVGRRGYAPRVRVTPPGLPNPSPARVSGGEPVWFPNPKKPSARQVRPPGPHGAAPAVLRGFGVRAGRRGPRSRGAGVFSPRPLPRPSP